MADMLRIGNMSARLSRVAIAAGIALTVATGCSVNTTPLSYGLNDRPATPAYAGRPEGGFAEKRAPKPRRTAALQLPDRKQQARQPATKAPPGALADRDYSATQLDADRARQLINDYRRQNGLKALSLDALLTKAAKAHSRDLAKWDRISHFGSDGSNPWDRVKRAGYKARLAAENVGTGQATLEEVMAGWKKSPGHNKNLLLRDAEHMGIALVQAPKTEFRTFWTLVIGSRL